MQDSVACSWDCTPPPMPYQSLATSHIRMGGIRLQVVIRTTSGPVFRRLGNNSDEKTWFEIVLYIIVACVLILHRWRTGFDLAFTGGFQ